MTTAGNSAIIIKLSDERTNCETGDTAWEFGRKTDATKSFLKKFKKPLDKQDDMW